MNSLDADDNQEKDKKITEDGLQWNRQGKVFEWARSFFSVAALALMAPIALKSPFFSSLNRQVKSYDPDLLSLFTEGPVQALCKILF